MKLYEVQLSSGSVPSISVKMPGAGWTGQTLEFKPFWMDQGYDGVLVKGAADGSTVIGDHAATSILLSRFSGHVVIENCTINAGPAEDDKGRAIFAGFDAINTEFSVPFSVTLKSCRVNSPVRSTWSIHSYQCDLFCYDTVFQAKNNTEHCVYMHGFWDKGAVFQNCQILGVGAEGLKFTSRPSWRYIPDGVDVERFPHRYIDGMHPPKNGPENCAIRVYDCTIEDWHQDWSWRGGAGMAVQGAGVNVHVKGTKFIARQSNYSMGRCLMIDDSGWEHFSPDGVAGEGPANGHVLIEDCLMWSTGPVGGQWPNAQPIIRINHINGSGPGTGDVARSFQILRTAVVGPETRVEIEKVNPEYIRIDDVNTPEAFALAAEAGAPSLEESMLQLGGYRPISAGYIGSFFVAPTEPGTGTVGETR